MKHFKTLIIGLLGLALFSCEEVIELPLSDQASEQIVIDGLLTDLEGPYTVRLSTSRNYFDTETPPPITGAIVLIEENGSLTDTLVEVNPGEYQTTQIVGEPGSHYKLRVWIGDDYYEAEETMPSHVPITSMSYYPVDMPEDLDCDVDDCRQVYEIFLTAQEPGDETNYYFWKVYENGELQLGQYDLRYSDDALVNGSSVEEFPLDAYGREGDSIRTEMLSLTKSAYEYWWGVDEQMNYAGGPTGSPPDNIKNNLSNGAHGYFMVTSVSGWETLLEPLED